MAVTRAWRALALGALVFFCSKGAFAEGAAAATELAPDDYERVMRAIVLVENKLASDGRTSLLMRPMSSECALLNCGRAQEELAFLLMRQGVPAENLMLVQTEELFGRHSLSHAMLFYKTRSRDGKPILLALDPTFPQFAALDHPYILPQATAGVLAEREEGRKIVTEVTRQGFWIVTDDRLSAFNAAMTVDDHGNARVRATVLTRDVVPSRDHERDMKRIASRPRNQQNYLFGLSLDEALKEVDLAKISRRVAVGSRRSPSVLLGCRLLYKILREKTELGDQRL